MGAKTYDLDFVAWTEQQAAAFRAHPLDVTALDTERLAEEIEDIGREHIRRVSSFLMQMLVHQLELHLDPNAPAAQGWFREVVHFQAEALLALSPGMKQRLDPDNIWRLAKRNATARLTGYTVDMPVLPDTCPLTLDDMLSADFDANRGLEAIAAAMP